MVLLVMEPLVPVMVMVPDSAGLVVFELMLALVLDDPLPQLERPIVRTMLAAATAQPELFRLAKLRAQAAPSNPAISQRNLPPPPGKNGELYGRLPAFEAAVTVSVTDPDPPETVPGTEQVVFARLVDTEHAKVTLPLKLPDD